MTVIRQADLIESVAAALQFISYYHPADYITHLARAYEAEQSPAAKDAIEQILTNSRMCAEGKRPICQDTGIVNVFLKVGMDVRWEGFTGSLEDAINEGVRRAYNNADNKLRASIVDPPEFGRHNTTDNTPAVISVQIVPGGTIDVIVAAKGGGSENKSKFVMLNPSDSIVDWVLKTVPTMGAGWCPPGMLGIGIGGTAEKAMLLAKESLMDEIDMSELLKRGPQTDVEKLRVELYEKVNALGIGAQGLGGLSTVLDVKIRMYPTHAAGKPVAMIPNCAATRHAHFVLDGKGPAYIEPPSLDLWPDVNWKPDYQKSRRVNLDTLTKAEVAAWKPGQTLLLSRQDADRPRRCAQANWGHAEQGREIAGGLYQPRHLLRRPGRSGARRSGRTGRSDYCHPHGQVHRNDAGPDGTDRDDRQGRTRAGRRSRRSASTAART